MGKKNKTKSLDLIIEQIKKAQFFEIHNNVDDVLEYFDSDDIISADSIPDMEEDDIISHIDLFF